MAPSRQKPLLDVQESNNEQSIARKSMIVHRRWTRSPSSFPCPQGSRLLPVFFTPSTRTFLWRKGSLWSMFFLFFLVFFFATHTRQMKRHCQNLFRHFYYSFDPAVALGRSDAVHPAPLCYPRNSQGDTVSLPQTTQSHKKEEEIKPLSPQRNAVLTYLRNDEYVALFRQLECTLRRSSPKDVEVAVMYVPGELSNGTLSEIKSLNVTLIEIEELHYDNFFEKKYSRNWVKLRAWGLQQYDQILLVDSDTAFVADIRPLFSLSLGGSLEVQFAAVPDQSRWLGVYKTSLQQSWNGGVILLRPCREVMEHMISLLNSFPKLRFSYGIAEQDFLSWYFKYTGWTLPLEYNVQASQSLLDNNKTVGGRSPQIVHFTENTKPWSGPVGLPGHQFLCSRDELLGRTSFRPPSTPW